MKDPKDNMSKTNETNHNSKRNSPMTDIKRVGDEEKDEKALKSPRASDISMMTLLPEHFVPGPEDVLCARGKTAYNHPGNRRFRKLIANSLQPYSEATSKLEKTLIVSSIMESVRAASPEGGFVRIEGGRWYEVGDQWAREKVGQSLRDVLHNKYRSSTKSKKNRRRVINSKLNDDVTEFMQSTSCREISERIQHLAELAKEKESDIEILQLFNQANVELLATLKNSISQKNTDQQHSTSLPIEANNVTVTSAAQQYFESQVVSPSTRASSPVIKGGDVIDITHATSNVDVEANVIAPSPVVQSTRSNISGEQEPTLGKIDNNTDSFTSDCVEAPAVAAAVHRTHSRKHSLSSSGDSSSSSPCEFHTFGRQLMLEPIHSDDEDANNADSKPAAKLRKTCH